MKKSFLILVIAGFMVIGLSEIQAQTTQPKLNQVELMKQLIGSWKADMGKDTTFFMEVKPFGTGLECYSNTVNKGKILMEAKQLAGYDKKIDKIVYVNLEKGKDIEILAVWFISNNKYMSIPYSDIANPEKASFKYEAEFKSPNLIVETLIINGKPLKTYTYTRIK
jgi:hypothetical protein